MRDPTWYFKKVDNPLIRAIQFDGSDEMVTQFKLKKINSKEWLILNHKENEKNTIEINDWIVFTTLDEKPHGVSNEMFLKEYEECKKYKINTSYIEDELDDPAHPFHDLQTQFNNNMKESPDGHILSKEEVDSLMSQDDLDVLLNKLPLFPKESEKKSQS